MSTRLAGRPSAKQFGATRRRGGGAQQRSFRLGANLFREGRVRRQKPSSYGPTPSLGAERRRGVSWQPRVLHAQRGFRACGVGGAMRVGGRVLARVSLPVRGAPRNILGSWCGLRALPVSGSATLGEPGVGGSVFPDGKPRRASSTMSRPRGSVATSSPTDQSLEVEPPPGGERQGGTALRQRRAGCRGRTRSGGPRVGGEGWKPRRHARAPCLKPDEPQGRQRDATGPQPIGWRKPARR